MHIWHVRSQTSYCDHDAYSYTSSKQARKAREDNKIVVQNPQPGLLQIISIVYRQHGKNFSYTAVACWLLLYLNNRRVSAEYEWTNTFNAKLAHGVAHQKAFHHLPCLTVSRTLHRGGVGDLNVDIDYRHKQIPSLGLQIYRRDDFSNPGTAHIACLFVLFCVTLLQQSWFVRR